VYVFLTIMRPLRQALQLFGLSNMEISFMVINLIYRSLFVVTGFNAAVAGCFFAIETVLRPLRAENSPPFTTAMIILASVISSTVSNALLGTQSAFTVPSYDLKSAAGTFNLNCKSFS